MPQDWKNFTKPDDNILKEQLSPIQYKVTRKDGTEKPFENEYNANKEEGIYVDVISGEPLFSSKEKYDSGTGWPSFFDVIKGVEVVTKEDRSIFMRKRTEVRSPIADSHLGHVFDDGPAPTQKRYCMNSAAMRFVPKAQMQEEGYADFLDIFS